MALQSMTLPRSRSPATSWVLVFALVGVNTLSFVDRYTLTILVEPIRAELNITDTELGFLQGTGFAWFYAVLAIPCAWLSDRGVRRIVISAGMGLWSLMTIGAGFAASFGLLLFSRIGVASGEATLTPAAYSMLADSFPPSRLSLPTSLFAAGTSLGTAIAFLGGGQLYASMLDLGGITIPALRHFSPWQSVMLILGLVGLFASPLLLLLREPPRRASRDHDNRAGLLPALRFLYQMRRIMAPLFLAFGLAGLAGNSVMSWTSPMLTRQFGLSVSQVGYFSGGIFLLCGIGGNVIGGWISDRIERRGVTGAKLLVAACMIGLQVIPNTLGPQAPNATLVLLSFAATISIGGSAGPVGAALQTITPNRLRGMVSALFFFCYNIVGLGIGPLAVGWLSDHQFDHNLAKAISSITIAVGPLAAILMLVAARRMAGALQPPPAALEPT